MTHCPPIMQYRGAKMPATGPMIKNFQILSNISLMLILLTEEKA